MHTETWRELLAEAVKAEGCAAVARRLEVSRPAVSLLNAGKYPGNEKYMARRVMDHFGKVPCPYLGRDVERSQCARSCIGDAPTCSPAALRHWRMGQECQYRQQGDKIC